MAVTITKVEEGAGYQVWDITATADGDDNIQLPHGRSAGPYFVIAQDRLLGLSKWNWGSNVKGFTIMTKGTNPGSGDPGIQCTATLLWPQRSSD